jgi:putative transposase
MASPAMLRWGAKPSPRLALHRPRGTAADALIKSFNDRLRDVFPNETLFTSLDQARVKREERRCDYNPGRPHGVLDNLTPIA